MYHDLFQQPTSNITIDHQIPCNASPALNWNYQRFVTFIPNIDPTEHPSPPHGHKVLQQLSIPGDELKCILRNAEGRFKKTLKWWTPGTGNILAAFSYILPPEMYPKKVTFYCL